MGGNLFWFGKSLLLTMLRICSHFLIIKHKKLSLRSKIHLKERMGVWMSQCTILKANSQATQAVGLPKRTIAWTQHPQQLALPNLDLLLGLTIKRSPLSTTSSNLWPQMKLGAAKKWITTEEWAQAQTIIGSLTTLEAREAEVQLNNKTLHKTDKTRQSFLNDLREDPLHKTEILLISIKTR